ncbi:MAG: hypothetical protein ACXVA9_13695 [Bdellovibrionales bacterium]
MTTKLNLKTILIAGGLLILIILSAIYFFGRKSEISTIDEGAAPRKDVLEWITKYSDGDLKKVQALTRLAEADQYVLTHLDAVMDAEELDSQAMGCYFIAFPNGDEIDGMPVYDALAALTFNTYKRARKRMAFLGRLSGHVLQLTDILSWEKQCASPLTQ